MNKKSRIVILGNSAMAKIAHHYFTHDSEYEVVAFTVNEQYITDQSFQGLPTVALENIESLYPPREYKMFVAMGYAQMNKLRANKYYEAKARGYELVSYISSRCSFLTEDPVGDNCMIMEDNTIQPFVRIGNDIVLWSGNHIGHEAIIDDHCFITSHVVVSGFVHIHPYCFLGVNASIRDGITIASETLVGAGAIIMKDTVEKGVYLPARSTLFDKKSDEIVISD